MYSAHARTLSKSEASEFLASLLTADSRRLITSATCGHRLPACSMLYGSCAVTVFQHLRCKTYFLQLLLRRSPTVRQCGLVPAPQLIAHGLTRFSDAVNDKISDQRTCRSSLNCLMMQTKLLSGESSRTLNTYSSGTCLNAFQSATISGNDPIASPSFPRLSISLTETF